MKRVLLLALALGACTKDPTQLVVFVETDLAVPGELIEVHAVVLDDQGGTASEHRFPTGELGLPFSFGVTPRDGPKDQRVTVELEAIGPTGSLFVRRAVTQFKEEKTLLLRMFLAKRCEGVTCEPGLTCTQLGCEDEVVPSSSLVEIEPGDERRLDGGVVVHEDAGVEKSAILVVAGGGLRTSESGGTASFSVELAAEPTSYVAVPLEVSDPAEGSIAVDLLTFTPLDWNVPKTVVVTGLDDRSADGDREYAIITSPAISGDPAFEGVDPPDVALLNEDDDTSAILLMGSQGLSTTERGGTATFSVVLASQPSLDVLLRLASSDPSEGAISTASIAFTPIDWDVAREVIVTGRDDGDMDGPVAFDVTIDPAQSEDRAYAALGELSVTIINADDEAAGVTVSPTAGLLTTEGGETAMFSVVLNTEPSGPVTIGLTSSNTDEGTVDPSSLLFDDQSWSIPQIVTVTGVDDAVDDGDADFTIVTEPALSADPEYAGSNAADVSVTNQDDEVADVLITPLAGLVTSEAGDVAMFMVRLASAPVAEVRIGFSSSDTSEGTVDPAELTFDGTDWSTPKTVIITGADDPLVDGAIAYTVISAAAVSLDPSYTGIDPDDVSVSNADDDSPGVTVSPTAVMTTEGGGAAMFGVRLLTMPSADVTILLSSSDTGEAVVMPSSLRFVPSAWNMVQMVTVTGVDDGFDDGDIVLAIVTAPATSSDPAYDGYDPDDVSVTNRDDDTAQIILSQTSGLTTTEAGGTAGFTVRLGAQPTQDVSLGLTSNDISEGTVTPSSLTFNGGNWSAPQMVTLRGAEDFVDDGNVGYTIVTAPATSGDPAYAGMNPPNVSATNIDDDTAGIEVTPFDGHRTRESGQASTFTMRLQSQPTADVTFNFVFIAAEVSISVATLTFTPASWSMPQSIEIIPVDDGVLDGDQPFTINTPPAMSGDPLYAGRNAQDVTGVNVDDGALPPTVISTPDGSLDGLNDQPSLSADGTLVAFVSSRSDLVPGDFNGTTDVFVFARSDGSVTRVSLGSAGVEGNGASSEATISPDGRWVAFQSGSTNLVPNDNNGEIDVFLHDRMTAQTTRVSVTSLGGESTYGGEHPGISLDGRYVVFYSLFQFEGVAGHRLWRHDRLTAMTTASGFVADIAREPGISADGRFVLFEAVNGATDSTIVRLYDRQTGSQLNLGAIQSKDPWITSDGINLGYASLDDPMVPGDVNGLLDVFVRDRVTNAIELISVPITGTGANADSEDPSVSDDGRWVVFASSANNLVLSPTVPGRHVYARDRQTDTTWLVASGVDGRPRISSDGRFVVFTQPGINPTRSDVFLVSRP
jgi:Tol biopolymer transport system component